MRQGHSGIANLVPFRGSLGRELQLVREAIAMVASGKAPRVTLAGIGNGSTLLDQTHQLALDAGVDIVPLERADAAGVDLVVGRIRR